MIGPSTLMTLDVGRRLGPYEILAPLGTGGMGEVYRARDTRLGREVAVKILRGDRLADGARRRRFIQEARAASALNHPAIVTVHDIASEDGVDFIVMEYVPGKTLDALLRPRMPLAESLRIAVSVADALARAHAVGIVHRDLKPANIVVGPEGVVKVLDFGLATFLAAEGTDTEQDTMTEDTSERVPSGPGMIAGTPGYMSPEQATGGRIDARSDIFSFGCLLYEMVTGQRAFVGGSRAERLAAVRQAQPQAPTEFAADTPRDLEKMILRCLRKEPEKRFQHMADVKVALEEVREDPASAAASGERTDPKGRRRGRVAVSLAILGVTVAGFWLFRQAHTAPTPAPRVVALTASQGDEGWPTFSPDGNQVAFSWNGERGPKGETTNYDIWLKMIGSSEARRLTTDPASDVAPTWSPDGRQIAFLRLRPGAPTTLIQAVSPLGGAERRVGEIPATSNAQITWSPDGTSLVLGRNRMPGDMAAEAGGLRLVPLRQGEPRALTAPDPPAYDAHPAFSPDGRHLAFSRCAFHTFPPCDVHVVEVGTDLQPRGPARRLTHQAAGIVGLAWSRDGHSIIYSAAPIGQDLARLWRVSVDGDPVPIRLELGLQGAIEPATARSQDRLAFTQTTYDIDIHRFEPGRPSRPLLVSSLPDYAPTFSADGRRIAFESGRSGEQEEIWLADADGSNASQLTHGPGCWQGTPRFSPDGRQIAFESRGEDGFADVWVIDVLGGVPRRVTDGQFHNSFASWSRDGRFIYFRDDRADGRDISRVPAAGGKPERVTRGGGLLARESPDGKSLFYTQRDGFSPLFRLDLPDGPVRQVADCVQGRSLADGPDGMYYLGCVADGVPAPLRRLDPRSGRSHLLGTVAASPGSVGLAVSPDTKAILFVKTVDRGADLMLIESFR
jgi:eukaryotic-like serine/threonine-protein kinase